MIDKSNFPYRESTMGVVINDEGKFLVVNKLAYKPETEWSFPGGGIDEGESSEKALMRELEEELLSNKFEIVSKSNNPYFYEWPDEIIEKTYQKKGKYYKGQQLIQFFVKFLGDPDEIKSGDGIRETKWVSREDLKSHLIFRDQWENADKVIKEFEEII